MARPRIDVRTIQRLVVRARDHNVMIDEDLAPLYGVPVKALNQAVSRNRERFPADFMFRLKASEAESLRSQNVTAKTGRGGRRNQPYAFTEQGVAMLSSVLRTERAVDVNIAIMRTFVQIRRMMDSNRELSRRIDGLERKYDERFANVFAAIKALVAAQPDRARGSRRIGFAVSSAAGRK